VGWGFVVPFATSEDVNGVVFVAEDGADSFVGHAVFPPGYSEIVARL
jgi:hypothetical protein